MNDSVVTESWRSTWVLLTDAVKDVAVTPIQGSAGPWDLRRPNTWAVCVIVSVAWSLFVINVIYSRHNGRRCGECERTTFIELLHFIPLFCDWKISATKTNVIHDFLKWINFAHTSQEELGSESHKVPDCNELDRQHSGLALKYNSFGHAKFFLFFLFEILKREPNCWIWKTFSIEQLNYIDDHRNCAQLMVVRMFWLTETYYLGTLVRSGPLRSAATHYAASPYAASPYAATHYAASPYAASPYAASPYAASPYASNKRGNHWEKQTTHYLLSRLQHEEIWFTLQLFLTWCWPLEVC